MADAAQLRYPSLPENKSRMVRIAEYSRDCIKALREQTGIGYEGRQGGTLQLFRTAQQYESASKDIAVLKEAGVPYELLEAQQLSRVEPALAATCHKLTGGCACRTMKPATASCLLSGWRRWLRRRASLSASIPPSIGCCARAIVSQA